MRNGREDSDGNGITISKIVDPFRSRTMGVATNKFKCNMCIRCFSYKSHLTMHRRTHKGDRLYLCDVCDKYADPHGWKTVPVCGKSFNENGNSVVHQRIHAGEKPYPCVTNNTFWLFYLCVQEYNSWPLFLIFNLHQHTLFKKCNYWKKVWIICSEII